VARVGLVAGLTVVAVGAAGAAAVGFGGASGDGGTTTRGVLPAKTAEVTRQTLVDTDEVDGTLGYGDETTVRGSGGGTVTWLPAAGSTVERGQPLYRVDDEPVVLLYGKLPLYRPLSSGAEGKDVKQFETNLAALGYDGFTVDDEYTSATAEAVEEWQEDLGLETTGVVDSGWVAYARGEVRIAGHGGGIGSAAGGEILTYTRTSRVVTVDLAVDDRRLVREGAAATVVLPDGETAAAKVTSVGAVAEAPADPTGGGDPTIEVLVALDDPAALGDFDEGPVDVRFVASERPDVLTVPVAALVALAEGGYGVQVIEGDAARYVAVKLGLFADGLVEVSGEGLAEGMVVGMPA
jgi:peptidoglycan hydrolase-like protein with peptidoglycan-binding domain